jgi:PAS domain S-box-containing protein
MVSFRHPLRFNLWLLAMVGLICVVPSLLNLAGVDFGLKADGFSPLGNVRGLLLHTILLWSATCMAFFTFALAFFHYYVRRDFVTPVIGISILWGGFIDLFQTLAVDRFIQNTADSSLLIPFTWAIGRSFGIFILLLGVMILMVRKYRGNERGNARFFFLLAIAFGLAAFAIMDFLANSSNLPQIVFPDLLISRPWDVIPLFIYALAGLWVFRKFHAARRDSFSFAVWISVIPDIVAQLHMAFGSTELFDNSYNLAHIFKVISYMVPALGLLKDYVDIHHRLDMEVSERERSERDRRMLVALVDNTSEMIGLVGSQGEMSYCNRALVENLGIPLSEREGLPFSKIVNRATGSSLLRNLFDRAVQNGHAFGELELVTRDGSRLLPVQFSLFPVASNAFGASIFGIVMHDVTAQREQGEGRERHEQGLRRLISQRTAELALVNDKMRSELEGRKQLEAKLVEAQKMEAMGQLSAGIAHEINNPIGFVNVNLEMLTRYIQVYDKVLDGYGVLDQEPGKVDSVVNEVRQAKEELRYDQIRNDVGDLIAESRKRPCPRNRNRAESAFIFASRQFILARTFRFRSVG